MSTTDDIPYSHICTFNKNISRFVPLHILYHIILIIVVIIIKQFFVKCSDVVDWATGGYQTCVCVWVCVLFSNCSCHGSVIGVLDLHLANPPNLGLISTVTQILYRWHQEGTQPNGKKVPLYEQACPL